MLFIKKNLIFLSFILIFISPIHLFSQELELPKLPETKEDFIKPEKDFIAAEKWLETTPLGTNEEKRTEINAWIITWITNSPTVTINLRASILKVFDKNAQLLGVYMAGCSRYCIENNYSKEELKYNVAGLKAVINCYNLCGELKKDKALEKLIEKDKDGKLEEWVNEMIQKK